MDLPVAVRVDELILTQLACKRACTLAVRGQPGDAPLANAVYGGHYAGLASTNSST